MTAVRMFIMFTITRSAARSDYLHYAALMLTQYGLMPMRAAHCCLILAYLLELELFSIINTSTSFALYRIKSDT
jgi:hypothetical protein